MSSRSGCRSAPTWSPWGNSVGKWPDQTCHQPAEQVTPPAQPGVHKSAVKLLRNQARSINLSIKQSISRDLHRSILNDLYQTASSPLQPPLSQLALKIIQCSNKAHLSTTFFKSTRTRNNKIKMFQQRAAQRLLTTLRPHVTRRMIATQPTKAVQATVSKGEFFTSVIAFSGATGVILACVTAPSSSS